jgi:hypothetical protein
VDRDDRSDALELGEDVRLADVARVDDAFDVRERHASTEDDGPFQIVFGDQTLQLRLVRAAADGKLVNALVRQRL